MRLPNRPSPEPETPQVQDPPREEFQSDQDPRESVGQCEPKSQVQNVPNHPQSPSIGRQTVEPSGEVGETIEPGNQENPKYAGEVESEHVDGEDEDELHVAEPWEWSTGADEMRRLVIEPSTRRPH